MPKAVKTQKSVPPRTVTELLSERSLSEILSSRQTEEIVIGVCGPLGSGADRVAKLFKEKLEHVYRYTTDYIKLSGVIAQCYASLTNNKKLLTEINSYPEARRIEKLQDLGNELRSIFGNDILSQFSVEHIAVNRQEHLKKLKKPKEELISRRFATIIDSLKHPDEYALLSRVYGKMFYLVGVLCPEQTREGRLTKKPRGLSKEDAVRLIERDRGEAVEYGQQLLKTIQHSDFFVSNVTENVEQIPNTVNRFLDLMFNKKIHTPTVHEYAMHAAHSAAMRSGCMSRQVGAAIVNECGDIIATGRNDVPRCGGGLYTEGALGIDSRCLREAGGKQCRSDLFKRDILDKISEIIKKHMQTRGEICVGEIDSLFNRIQSMPELRGLIEFSRSVHAEMDAITTIARNGYSSLKNATLYCTTFPCHHCARHIVAAGIKKVYYVEPYEKSLAISLHDDSMVTDVQDDESVAGNGLPPKVKILPFEGVAPKQFINLFAVSDRKKDGSLAQPDVQLAKPVVEKFMDTYKEYEEKVTIYLREKLSSTTLPKK